VTETNRRRMIDKRSLLLNMPGLLANDVAEISDRLNVSKSTFVREAVSRHVMSFRHWLNEQERRVDRGL